MIVAFEQEHLEAVHGWVNDPALRELIGTIRPVSLFEHRRWYEAVIQDKSKLVQAILAKEGEAPVGLIGLTSIDLNYRNAELWLYVAKTSDRRQGCGRAAVHEMLRWAFGTLGLHRVFVTVFDYNETALAFFKACGFREEGRLRGAAFKRGRFVDKHILGILENELPASQE